MLDRSGPVVENMVENRLMWFEKVKRRYVDSMIKRADRMESSQTTRDKEDLKNYKSVKSPSCDISMTTSVELPTDDGEVL